jgi:diacylglycerol kinase
MEKQKFSFKKRLKSFSYALNGLRVMFKEEHNSRIHLFFTGIVLIFILLFRFTLVEYGLLAIAVGIVFASELFNSALENLADHLSPERDENIKKVKDLGAAAVLVSALTALIIGCLILGPKLIQAIQ